MIVSKSYRWSEGRARSLGPLLCLLATAGAGPAMADDVLDSLQLHGFMSQALVVTDDNNFFGPSSENGGSLQFTEIGLNASLRPHEDVLLAAQVLSRRAGGDGSDASPALDYGIVDYQMLADQRRTLGVQVGRFKNPFGFYNQTRDVAFTRPSILLPQSIYFDRTRSLALSADGLNLYAEERLPGGALRLQAGVGTPLTDEDLERQFGGPLSSPSIDGETSYIGQLLYEHDGGRFITALSTASVKASMQMSGDEGELTFRPWILSLQYNEELWSLTAEYALRNIAVDGFGSAPFNFDVTGESWYLQYSRRFLDDWQWLIRYDSLISNRDDRSGRAFEARGAGPAYSQFARDTTLGLQWRAHPQVLLAAEYHHVDGTGWLPFQDNPDRQDTSRRWNMFLFQLSLRF